MADNRRFTPESYSAMAGSIPNPSSLELLKQQGVGSNKLDYILRHYPYARAAADKIAQQYAQENKGQVDPDFLARMIVSQTGHESGWGESGLAKKYRNYGGLKATSSAKNKVALPTYEGSGETRQKITANFLTFPDDQSYYDYYASYLARRYPEAMNATDTRSYAEGLKKRGYYTDSVENYSRGLESGLKPVNLVANTFALGLPPGESAYSNQMIYQPVHPEIAADATGVYRQLSTPVAPQMAPEPRMVPALAAGMFTMPDLSSYFNSILGQNQAPKKQTKSRKSKPQKDYNRPGVNARMLMNPEEDLR